MSQGASCPQWAVHDVLNRSLHDAPYLLRTWREPTLKLLPGVIYYIKNPSIFKLVVFVVTITMSPGLLVAVELPEQIVCRLAVWYWPMATRHFPDVDRYRFRLFSDTTTTS